MASQQTTPPTVTPKGLHAKLCSVMAAIDHIPKRGHNDFHNYDYATESDIVDAVRSSLASAGVMLYSNVLTVDHRPVGDKDIVLTDVMVEFTFADADSDQTVRFTTPGCGSDKGDKGVYKALTGAIKYALLKTFLIPTGDDPEADTSTDAAANTRQSSPVARAGAAKLQGRPGLSDLANTIHTNGLKFTPDKGVGFDQVPDSRLWWIVEKMECNDPKYQKSHDATVEAARWEQARRGAPAQQDLIPDVQGLPDNVTTGDDNQYDDTGPY